MKKVVNRDNHDGGYLTFLERDQTYVFEYDGKTVEKEEKLSGILYEEGEQAELLYDPKKGTISHPGEKKVSFMAPAAMILAGLVCVYGAFVYKTNQPSIAIAAAAVMLVLAGLQVYKRKNAMKKSQEVECLITGIFRTEEKKGTYYFPVYELEYKGKRRRVIRSFEGDNDKSQIGKTEILHIDPMTADFAEGKKGVAQLGISISLTLVAAFLMLAFYLSVYPAAL